MDKLSVPLLALETCCRDYMQAPSEAPFTLADVTVDPELIKRERMAAAAAAKSDAAANNEPASPSVTAATLEKRADSEADLLSKMPQFVHLGPRFASSKKGALSEVGTEYEIACAKHTYANHVLLQFFMTNTLEDQQLEKVTVSLDLGGVAGLALESELPCDKLVYGSASMAFVCLRREAGVPTGAIPCTLKFLVKDVDPAKGEPEEDEAGYDDEYALEELELCAADYMKKVPHTTPT